MEHQTKIDKLRGILNYIDLRLGEFYLRGFYKDNPTRKEIYFILKDVKRVLSETKDNN